MDDPLSRRKKTLADLQAEKSKLEQKVSDTNQEIRQLNKQISEAARKERNARIYFRGGELTHHLQDKAETLTDEDIKLFLTYVFSFPRTQKLVSDMLAIRRGEADGSIKELVSNAMSGYGRTPFRGNDVQTS